MKEKKKGQAKRDPGPPRLNIGIERKTYRNVRMAASIANMEVNEWVRAVITEVARRQAEKLGLT